MLTKFKHFFEGKAWKAKKADVLQFWKTMRPNLPLVMNAVPSNHRGTRFRADGIRITGSPEFINSIMSRLKDLLQFEAGPNRLDVEYREIERSEGDTTPGTPEYVFYIHLVRNE